MTATWPDARKTAELRAKLSSLEVEFEHWRSETRTGEHLRKHHTQVDRVTRALDALRERIAEDLDQPHGPTGTKVVDIETMILDIHRIWEFFRAKLSQRYVPWFEPFLVAADQFAWDCYDPIRKAVDPAHVAPEAVREPPMVFFNGGWSPFTMSRGIEYEAEFVPDEDFPAERYRDILRNLPFPVIGVPWYQVRHLPDAVLLAHEVGHAVEDDFRLTDRLRALLAAGLTAGKVPPARGPGWTSWLGEVFADLYGVLGGGAAFVSALMDLVAGPVDRISAERAGPGSWDYPPAALRVHVALVALEATGFRTDRTTLEQRWKATWPRHAMEAFEDDTPPIVRALTTPIPELQDRSLAAVVPYAAQATLASRAADEVGNGTEPTTRDARALLAFARLAFDASPSRYETRHIQALVLDAVARGQDQRVRAGPPEAGGAGGAGEAGAGAAGLVDPAAAALGASLFERLAAMRSPAAPGPVPRGAPPSD